MSQTATKIDAKLQLAAWTRQLVGMYVNDLKAIDVSFYTKCPGGCARTIQEFTAEVVGFNNMVSAMLRGETPNKRTDEERAAFEAGFTSPEVCISSIKESGEALASGLENASDEAVIGEVMTPWGAPMQLFELANIAANHILYHDAQLNYIQSLNGDGEMHWFEG